MNEIAIPQTYALGSPYLWKVSGKKKKMRKTSYCNLYTKKACIWSMRGKSPGINEKLTLTWFHHHFCR